MNDTSNDDAVGDAPRRSPPAHAPAADEAVTKEKTEAQRDGRFGYGRLSKTLVAGVSPAESPAPGPAPEAA